ncbi:hypothetical protein IFM89_017363 [Coptis chinensis]|uniref:Uncharacterized protein n=1 Tax=Coptis chinensis TaxID=261450 RepID=A0A835LEQ9_9MAGN|nr:hypothetical protein IFM89_017363 [Coptis chinensis]
MEDSSSRIHSRKAEESALRRYQASAWLESFLERSIGLSTQPTEQEFVSCLRNGLILCNVINKIQPGSVPKVIESSNTSTWSITSEAQPLPAYQYFENVRNFLVAVGELNLPAFEASDLERDSLDAGSTAKIVDCILSLKSYHEYKQWGGVINGSSKHLRSPMVSRTAGRNQLRVALSNSSAEPCRHLDMSVGNEKTSLPRRMTVGNLKSSVVYYVDSIVEAFVECLLESKENIDQNLLASFRDGTKDSMKVFSKIMSSCLQGQQHDHSPEFKSIGREPLLDTSSTTSTLTESSSTTSKCKLLSCLGKGNCNHWHILKVQEKDLSDLKLLLSTTKSEFKVLQSQLHDDLQVLGDKVQEMSVAALGYQRVVKENRDLYNMVQDLKGNIRVYCRIRPAFGTETRSTVDHIGDDGSLVVVDPLKPSKEVRKIFNFNQVFGPTSTQDEVYKETQPLIRSVMDGYNVCIFAYGQTGSGKTHTMCGPSGESSKDMGINYLALNDLFQLSCTRKDIVDYDIQVQMVEIYNEQLEIRSCTSNGGLSLPDAKMYVVKSSADVLSLMKLGELNRFVSSTAMNIQSSRSHSVLTVHVNGKDTSGSILRSCLHLVDLAGSERVDKSEVTGDRLKEAQHINKSLSCLGDVITALAQKNSHIPYRNSKLTQLLQDSLGGHAKTLMFAHVSPEADSYGETISTLKFAQRVSTVELGVARLNKESTEVKELKGTVDLGMCSARQVVETLKKALSSKEGQILKSPRDTVKMSMRTPPRPRRLSIENSAVKTEKVVNLDNRKVSKTSVVEEKFRVEDIPSRPRRLSLEGPNYGKDHLQIRGSKNVSVNGAYRARVDQCISPYSQYNCNNSSSDFSKCENAEASNSSRNHSDGSSVATRYDTAPRSPTSACHSRIRGTESRIRRPIQLPKTPEPPTLPTKVVGTVTPSEFSLSRKSQTPGVAMSTTKKGSIRKSLMTIGKLINAPDKRNQQHPVGTLSYTTVNVNDKSTPAADARTLRRQSLTGGQTSGLSRRSSLGGNDSCSKDNRNARTPPPVHPSTIEARRWF